MALPTYNGARYVEDALRGVLAQQGIAFELIVCDDRSDDQTVDLVCTHARDRAQISVNSERLGLAGNWNRCMELSQTRWVAIFHQDDVMRPGHLASHVDAIHGQPGLGLVASAADVIGPNGEPVSTSVVSRGGLGSADRFFPAGALLPQLATSNPLRCSAVTILKDAHADVGGFDPSYRYVVDWDFWIRVARRWAVSWRSEPTVEVRWHPASETHTFKTGTADLDETIRLLDTLDATNGAGLPDARTRRAAANRRLARAFLNRAYDASHARDSKLVRHCLRRAFELAPLSALAAARDPRLVLRIAHALMRPSPSPATSASRPEQS